MNIYPLRMIEAGPDIFSGYTLYHNHRPQGQSSNFYYFYQKESNYENLSQALPVESHT